MMTNEDIIAAAYKVWGRDLYITTSLTEIALDLGVSKTALYRHFKDKEALLEAMRTVFFDNFSAFVKEGYEQAASEGDKRKCSLIMMRTIAEYYIRNRDTFVFSLVHVYSSHEKEKMSNEFLSRGIDMRRVSRGEEKPQYPSKFQLIVVTLIYYIANFHRYYSQKPPPSDELVKKTVSEIEDRILRGLELDKQKVTELDYGALEKRAADTECDGTPENDENTLLRAVAGAVAEAGPWNASMEMVAKRSGLSKSGLYAHFKNKQDMLGRFFIAEFSRIVNFARAQIETAEGSEEQLYLAIFSIVNYLRSRPEILAAMDWIKTRQLELGKPVSDRLFGIIKSIKIEVIQKYDPQMLIIIAQWILFLIMNTLAWWSSEPWENQPCKNKDWAKNLAEIPNESFRLLFRFIALGMEGTQDETRNNIATRSRAYCGLNF